MQSFSLIVSKDDCEEKTRIDSYLANCFDDYSRSYIQKIIKEENVFVNDKIVKANYVIKENDIVVKTMKIMDQRIQGVENQVANLYNRQKKGIFKEFQGEIMNDDYQEQINENEEFFENMPDEFL